MDAVENLSMLEKEKVCTLSHISCRRLAEKPTDASLQCAERTPVSNCSAKSEWQCQIPDGCHVPQASILDRSNPPYGAVSGFQRLPPEQRVK